MRHVITEDYADEAPEPTSTAAERLGVPFVTHSHGQHGPHVHTANDYAAHQRPITNERMYERGQVPEVTPPAPLAGDAPAELDDPVCPQGIPGCDCEVDEQD